MTPFWSGVCVGVFIGVASTAFTLGLCLWVMGPIDLRRHS